jgi:NAD dependent epimerase/dehydratase
MMSAYSNLTVAVTGADGFIGSHVVEALVREGARVRALSLYNSFGTAGWLDELSPDVRASVEIQAGDVRDPHFTRDFLRGVDIVFHLAALIAIPYSYRAPQSYVDVNVTGTLNVLEAVRNSNARRMIHTSTSEVYGTAQFTPITEEHPMQGQSPYSASKIGADHMVEAYSRSFDVPAVILRPFNTYGPRQSERAVIPTVIRQVLDESRAEIRLGDLAPVRDFNFVSDIAAAFLAAGLSDKLSHGTAYNAGSGVAVSVAEMVETVRAATGCNKPVVEEEIRFRPSNSEVYRLLAAPERFRQATGWAPQVNLRQGLDRTIDWWRQRIADQRIRPSADYLI